MALRTRFDTQAARFDARAGVGAAAPAIAAAVLSVPGPVAGGAVLLEIGAGTGEIGAELARALASTGSGGRYVALDGSRPMLEAFSRRQPPGALLVEADAAHRWPVRSAAVDVVFASRAVHLLDLRHVVAELTRVCRPGGRFLVGRVRRAPDGLRSRLRDRRRELLAAHGVTAGEGADRSRKLLGELARLGAEPLPRTDAARWGLRTDPVAVLADWEATATVGGSAVPPAVHRAVMADLRAWAPPEPEDEVETYTLEGVRLP